MFVVFDLDGTLANTDHRSHFLDRQASKKDWRGFFAACVDDTPHHHIIAVFHALSIAGHHIEIWSGRSSEVRAETEAWLSAHDMGHIPLRMRDEGDHTADEVLKRRWLLEADRRPDLIFDDRAKVVAMWRAEGVPCCQVAPGDF